MKIKLTKGELKRQRDALRQYERYLPTLQLKKQQLQLEIAHQLSLFGEKNQALAFKKKSAQAWCALLAEPGINIKSWLEPEHIFTGKRNIAGVDIPLFERVEFRPAQYDLFIMPLWVDAGLEALREIVCFREELGIIEKGLLILRHELRVTSQRVNLFEKVKIPEAKDAIRLIKIYIGDQMANAVGRSKMAKGKIEDNLLVVAEFITTENRLKLLPKGDFLAEVAV
jgi:V/A-type H+/Na+-transporting ATPase subunit D